MFQLTPLPYPYEALEPVISRATMQVHHDKHHKAYVDTLNQLLAEAGAPKGTLEEVIRQTEAEGGKLFNNAGQAWNHGFFWECMSPDGPKPEGGLAQAIDQFDGGLQGLREAFVKEGANHFASGWVWLAADHESLQVLSTHDGATLAGANGLTPLLVCDLWEHAYYLDHKNDRKGFLEAWFDTLANWRFAGEQWNAAGGQGRPWRYPAPQGPQGVPQAAE